MEKDLVAESKRIARAIVVREFRKSLGKYYLSWTAYDFLTGITYVILANYPLYYYIALFSLLGIFIFLSGRFFLKAYSSLFKFFSAYEVYGKYSLLAWILGKFLNPALYIISVILIFVGGLLPNFQVFLVGIVLLVFSVDSSLYITYVVPGMKYYDILALITFTVCIPLANVTSYSQIAYLVFGLSWLFAGYKSLMEVVEGE